MSWSRSIPFNERFLTIVTEKIKKLTNGRRRIIYLRFEDGTLKTE